MHAERLAIFGGAGVVLRGPEASAGPLAIMPLWPRTQSRWRCVLGLCVFLLRGLCLVPVSAVTVGASVGGMMALFEF